MAEPGAADLDGQIRVLRRVYLEGAGERVDELARNLSRLRDDASDGGALRDLMRGFHRLAGSGGTFGLDEVTELGNRGEKAVGDLIGAGRKPQGGDIGRLESLVTSLRETFDRSGDGTHPARVAVVSEVPKDVLLVEDDPETARDLQRGLREAGFETRWATTCDGAKEAVIQRFPFALVTETALGEGSGYDLVRWFRDQPGGGTPPVLAVSHQNRFQDKVEALTCGADGFLSKPLDPADLARRLSALLSKQQAPATRILAVEDDPDQAEYLRVVLESAGYEVRACGDPGVFERELAEFRPDLVILDVDLPGTTGIELVRYLRQEDAYLTLPAIFLTRHSEVDQQVRALEGGGDDFITKPASPARILASVAARVEKARLLQGLVERDGLTGLLTHSAFFERAKGILLKRRRRPGETAALVMLDMDHFKSVNDRYGHPTGDRVLCALGGFLRKRLRQSDVLGRYGGEEFALLLEDLQPQEVERLVLRLLEEFAGLRHPAPDGKSFSVTLSAGLAFLGAAHESLEQWLSEADAALYEAKAAGRNRLRGAAAPGVASDGGPPAPPAAPDPILGQGQECAILATLQAGVVLLAEDGLILWCNPAAERILGSPVGHLPGKPLSAQLRDPVREDGSPLPEEDFPWMRVLGLGHQAMGVVVGWTRADGSRTWLSVGAQPSPRGGKSTPWAAVVSFEDITLRKRIQEDLRKLTTAVVNNPASIVITDPDGNIEYVNPKFERATGYASEEVLGQNPRILKSGKQGAEFYRHMWREISSGREWRGEFHNLRKDGSSYWESAAISPVKDASGAITHYVAVKEDITVRRQVENALRANEARFRSLLNHAMNGLITVGDFGAIEGANPAAEEMFGFGDGEMSGMPMTRLLPDCPDGEMSKEKGPRQRRVPECRARRKDGTSFSARISIFEFPTPEGLRLGVEVEDITELKGAERVKREFVSVVSHELRTPLTSIRGSLGLIAGGVAGVLPPAANELVAIALKNCQRLTMLINDILDLEKSESGKMEFHLVPVDLMDALRHSVDANGAYAIQFGARLELLGGPDGLVVLADADRFQQVLANLISNAAKFSPKGAPVEVWAEAMGSGARVSVRDCGPGIRKDFQEHMFHRFAQADHSDGRRRGGTGLGLSICKTMVEGMGGSIGFETAEGQGTTVYFDLPGEAGGGEPPEECT